MTIRIIAIALLALALSGCGGGSATGGAGATPVTLHFSDGRVSATGFYVAGTTTPTGHWQRFFDDASGRKQWEGDYAAGAIDNGKPWREWNLDSSIRVDSTD